MNDGLFHQRRRRSPPPPPPRRANHPAMGGDSSDMRNSKRRIPRKPQKSTTKSGAAASASSEAAAREFREFLAEQAARRGAELRNRLAAARVKDLLEQQLAMIRLTKQMNKLLQDLKPKEYQSNPRKSSKKPSKPSSSSNEYVIFSGGPKGLEYTSLTKSETGTFCMEIDVSDYDPENVQINTEDNRTMHVKAYGSAGARKTLKIISPDGIDIDDVIIHYPKHGILLLEAP